MLNKLNTGPSEAPPASGTFFPGPERPAAARERAFAFIEQHDVPARLFVRRWLILLFLAALLSLWAFYGLPWYSIAFTALAFCCGAGFIPLSGLQFLQPAQIERNEKAQALQVATALAGALPEPAILLAQDGTILLFNCKASELFRGLKTGAHLSSATRNPQVLDAVMGVSALKPLQTVMFYDRVPVERYMAATVSWLELGGRVPPAILLFLHDLTEQRRLDQLRADFIANASHEIKTPLASLLGFIDTLQGAARHDETARDRFLTIMAKQAQRMARLIDNLMSLSRVEMRAHLKPQDTVMIAELAEQACDMLEPMAAEANVKVEANCDLPSAAVLGDRDELTQVFINLIHNAIKYGRTGGVVKVSVQRVQNGSAPAIEVAVEDDGPGISGQHLPRLTERFYRVPGPAALEKSGTGLGLAIVKHVVNRHRGELRITSAAGAGSRFAVILAEHTPM